MHRITFNSSDLKPAISRLSRVVKEDAMTQILGCALLKVDGNKATLTGTDTQLTIITGIPCESEGQVSVAIAFTDLVNLSKIVSNNVSLVMDVKIDNAGGKVPSFSIHVQAGKSNWDYAAFDPILFPITPALEDATSTELDPDLVLGMITAQGFLGMNPLILWTCAVALHLDGDKVRAVGCAQSGLYESDGYTAGDLNGRPYIMLPKAAVGIIDGLPATTGIELMIPADPNVSSVGVRQGDTTIFIRLVDGEYVKYKSIVPTDYTLNFSFNAEELLDAVRSVSIGTRTSGPKGQVSLEIKDLTLTLVAHNYDEGKTGTSSIELIANNGGDISALFSSALMMDHLSKLNGVTTASHAGENNKCFLFQDESKTATHLIMPMRL